MKRPFLFAALFMLLALWPLIRMNQVVDNAGFQLKGFKTAVLQAEFPASNKDVFDLYGAEKTTERAGRTDKMRQAHAFDNLFLLGYGLFLLVFAFQGYRLSGWWRFLAMMFLAALAVVADLCENGIIIAITNAVDAGANDFSADIKRLAFLTWLKWLSLALYFGFLIRFFSKAAQWGNIPNWMGKLLAGVCAAGVLVSFTAFLTNSVAWENRMAEAFKALFFVLFLFCLFFRKTQEKPA